MHPNYEIPEGLRMACLEEEIRQYNIMSKSFEMTKDELNKADEMFGTENTNELLFNLSLGMDRRRFDFQEFNQVVGIFFTDADGDIPEAYIPPKICK